MKKDNPLIVALDVADWQVFTQLVDTLSPLGVAFKVGMETFYRWGAQAIEYIQKKDLRVFLDLKLHDIPNTIKRTLQVLADLRVWMVNLHIASGRKALEGAVEVCQAHPTPPLLIGVTVLTSLSEEDLQTLGLPISPESWAIQLAEIGYRCGLDGVVCSPWEVKAIKAKTSPSFLAITPGIRLKPAKDDQKRTASPKEALKEGADYLVMGRPILTSPDPLKTVTSLLT